MLADIGLDAAKDEPPDDSSNEGGVLDRTISGGAPLHKGVSAKVPSLCLVSIFFAFIHLKHAAWLESIQANNCPEGTRSRQLNWSRGSLHLSVSSS